jgi:type IV fimbrial biogenesis protein FimT
MQHTQQAMTVLELLITLAVISILTAIAVPAWHNSLIYGSRAGALNDLRASLAFARSSAIVRGRTVVLCTSQDHRHCDHGDWNEGWIIYEDRNENYKRDAGETVLRVHPRLDTSALLSGNRLIAHHVGFLRSGLMHGVHNGTITYRSKHPSPRLRRCLIVSRSGRIRAANGTNCHV